MIRTGACLSTRTTVVSPGGGTVPARHHRSGRNGRTSFSTTVVVASAEQISCPLGEEAAILNLKNSVYYGMNPVGARVWELLKQPKSVSELRDVLLDEYEVEHERCAQDLLELLHKMRAEGLIEVRVAAAP